MVSEESLRARLLEKFHYENGLLIRKIGNEQWPAAEQVGSKCPYGYLRTDFEGKTYFVHRLIFLMENGYLPDLVDHKDGIRTNNLVTNLRDASSKVNNLNRTVAGSNNKLGILGVSRSGNRYRAQLSGKNLGRFDTAEEAKEVYERAKLAANERSAT